MIDNYKNDSAVGNAIAKLNDKKEAAKATVELLGAYSTLADDSEAKDTANRIREAIFKQVAAIENSI